VIRGRPAGVTIAVAKFRTHPQEKVVTMAVGNTLEHIQTSVDTAQGLLDHAQNVLTGLEAAQQRVDKVASVLRHATAGLIVGGLLLGVLVVRQHRAH
jgi:paraquat-inducible protein B